MSVALRWITRSTNVRSEEMGAAVLSAAYFFTVLCAYYILRPIRDEMAVAGGVENLPLMFTGTLILMIIVNPPFAALVAKYARDTFVIYAYRFFALNLLVFFVLLLNMPEEGTIWIGRAFYWWVSVFNLFVVSIFWAFMSDVWSLQQSKRVYGFIGVGGTIGAMSGAALTTGLVGLIGREFLMLVSVVLLEVAVFIVRRLSALFSRLRRVRGEQDDSSKVIGGTLYSGIVHVVQNPYLLAMCVYMLCYTIVGTFLYYQQAEIAATIQDRDLRTAFFGSIDTATNALTLFTQLFLTGHIMRRLGVGVTLAALPALCVIGFTGLGVWPTAIVIVVFQVLRRGSNFALARPAKESLYTVVEREDRFKAKALIDTFVYRGGDQIGVWSYAGLSALGLGMASIAFTAVPIAGLWLAVGLWLGKRQSELAGAKARAEASTQ